MYEGASSAFVFPAIMYGLLRFFEAPAEQGDRPLVRCHTFIDKKMFLAVIAAGKLTLRNIEGRRCYEITGSESDAGGRFD